MKSKIQVKRKDIFLFLLILIGTTSCLFGQEEPTLVTMGLKAEKFKVNIFKKKEISLELEALDSIQFTFNTSQERILSKINIIHPNGFLTTMKKQNVLEAYLFVAQEAGEYIFQFKQNIKPNFESLKGRKCKVQIDKIFTVQPPPPPTEPVYLDTLFQENVIKSIKVTKVDTLYEYLPESRVIIPATKNIFNKSRRVIPLEIPPDCNYLLYWIGVGHSMKGKYDKLSKRFEKNETIGNPLVAYHKNKINNLPTSVRQNDVKIQITKDSLQSENYKRGETIVNAFSANQGILGNKQLSDTMYFCYENQLLASNVSIYLHTLSININVERDTTRGDTMIISRQPLSINLKSENLEEMEQELDDLEAALYSSEEQFLLKINAQIASLDSLKSARLKEFKTAQDTIVAKRVNLLNIRTLAKDQNISETEARAIIEAENAQTALADIEAELVKMQASLEALQKANIPIEGFELPTIEVPKEPKGIIGFFQKLFGKK